MMGWSFIVFIAGNMLVHFSLLVKETINTCKIDCKKRCCKQKIDDEELWQAAIKKAVELDTIKEAAEEDF